MGRILFPTRSSHPFALLFMSLVPEDELIIPGDIRACLALGRRQGTKNKSVLRLAALENGEIYFYPYVLISTLWNALTHPIVSLSVCALCR